MKKIALLLSIVLVAWVVGASYYYVCKIRKHCNCSEKTKSSDMSIVANLNAQSDSLQLKDSVSAKEIDTLAVKLAEVRNYLNNKDLSVIRFNFAKKTTRLTSSNQEYLNKIVFLLKNDTGAKICIEGHSDNIGSETAKTRFGEDRANFLKDVLINKGVNPNQVKTKSHSDKKPVTTNDTKKGRAQNRRTEILILNQ